VRDSSAITAADHSLTISPISTASVGPAPVSSTSGSRKPLGRNHFYGRLVTVDGITRTEDSRNGTPIFNGLTITEKARNQMARETEQELG
jgi:hypothetical protein